MADLATLENWQLDPDNPAVALATIRLPQDLDFPQQLKSLKNSGANDLLDTFDDTTDQPSLERPIRFSDGRAYLLRLTALGDQSVALRVQADDNTESAPGEAQVKEAFALAVRRFWWQLDMEAVREALSVNEYGQELLNRYWPLRPANLASPWEGLLKTVVSVQIYPGLAQRLQQALLEFYSDGQATFDGKLYRFYPSPTRLAEVIPEDLVGMRFSRQKARYLPAIANMLLEQPERYDWEVLRNLPGPEAAARLDELPGVGPWTSHYVAMRGLPHEDIFSEEAGLRKLLAANFGGKAELSVEAAAHLTEVYSPHRSMACYYSYMKMYNA